MSNYDYSQLTGYGTTAELHGDLASITKDKLSGTIKTLHIGITSEFGIGYAVSRTQW